MEERNGGGTGTRTPRLLLRPSATIPQQPGRVRAPTPEWRRSSRRWRRRRPAAPLPGPRDDGCSHVEIDAAFERPGQQPRQMRVGFRLRDQPSCRQGGGGRLSPVPEPAGELLQQRADRRGEPSTPTAAGRITAGVVPESGEENPAIGLGRREHRGDAGSISRTRYHASPAARPAANRSAGFVLGCRIRCSLGRIHRIDSPRRPQPVAQTSEDEGSSVIARIRVGVQASPPEPLPGRARPTPRRPARTRRARRGNAGPQVFPAVPWRGAARLPALEGALHVRPEHPGQGDSRLRLPVASIRTRL